MASRHKEKVIDKGIDALFSSSGLLVVILIFVLFMHKVKETWAGVASFMGFGDKEDTSQEKREDELNDKIQDNPAAYRFEDGTLATGRQIQEDAMMIADALGTDSGWWNPASWTEDEDAVLDVLYNYNPPTFVLLAAEYRKNKGITTNSLQNDLKKYLSGDDFKKIDHLW